MLQALTLGTDRVISHLTAASFHGMTDEVITTPFHLTSPRLAARVKRPGLVVGHRSDIPDDDVHSFRGLPLTSPTRTWSDVATTSTFLDALVITDAVIRSGREEFGEPEQPLATKEELAGALTRRGPARGVRTAWRALELSRDGSDSAQETRLRHLMHEAGLPEPEVNTWIRDAFGNGVVQSDLSLREHRISIQYEGLEFHSSPEQMLKDVRRAELTEALGWVEVRITKEHMRDGGRHAVEKIRRALRRRGWRG